MTETEGRNRKRRARTQRIPANEDAEEMKWIKEPGFLGSRGRRVRGTDLVVA